MEPLNEIEKEQRWPIKSDYREAIVKRLVRIVADPSSSTQEVTTAARALILAEKQNQHDDQRLELELDRERNRFFARALELGIAETPRELPDRTAKTNSPGAKVATSKPTTKKRATKKRATKKTTRKKPRRGDSGAD